MTWYCELSVQMCKKLSPSWGSYNNNKLFLCLEKCEFCKEQIEYLGLVILENEVSIDLVKVAEVWE